MPFNYIISFNNQFAQEPAYFKMGKKELSGVDACSIFQDDERDYWFATNNDLYKYDCFEFERIPVEHAKE